MNINKRCKLCRKKGKIKCEKCNQEVYCSRDCQFKDWNVHKSICEFNSNRKLNLSKINFRKSMNIENKIKDNNNLNPAKKRSSVLLVEVKVKKRSTTNFSRSKKRKIDEYPPLENFNFLEKFYDILFKRNQDVSPMSNSDESIILRKKLLSNRDIIRNEKIEKIKQMQVLLMEHRNFLKSKILLNSSDEKNFKYLYFMIDTYSRIESYIFNFLLLIRFLYSLKDPISLIKADQTLKELGDELFIISKNNKQGFLVYSIETIIKRFLEQLQSRDIYQTLNSITNVLKRFLSIISSIIKISYFLGDYIIYQKALIYYDKIFTISLKFISIGRETEKTILKCNLGFNLANIFIKKEFINSAVILYKNIIQDQKTIEPCTFLCGIVYYNISVIYFVMDKIKESEFYLNEGFEKINKLLDSRNAIRQIENFRILTRMFILLYAEIDLEKQNYDKALECIKLIIENMIDSNKNIRRRRLSTISDNEIPSLKAIKQLRSMLRNYIKQSNYPNKKVTRLNKEEIVFNKNRVLSALESLYEVKFYSTNVEKAFLDDKIKKYVNGFLDKIITFCIEKEKEEGGKLKKEENLEIKNDTPKKSDKNLITNHSKNNKKELDIIKETENNLPELNLTNITKINNSETDNNLNNFIRGRNRTISKQVGKNYLKERGFEDMNKENENNNTAKISNDKTFLNDEISRKIISHLNEKMLRKKKILQNEKNISDFEYFFLLLTSLSYRQIEILNETQIVNVTDDKYINLPILFSKQFKNSLNPTQKQIFNKLRILSLIRSKILKDPKNPITIDNYNSDLFNINLKFNDYKIKNKNISQIMEDINRAEQSKKKTIIIGKFKNRVPIKSESIFSMYIDENNTKDIVINFLKYKIRNIKNESDSEDINDNSSKRIDNDLDFKYQDKYDINIIRKKLIKKINKKSFDEKEKELYKDIINSSVFIQLMNCYDFCSIQEFIENLDVLIKLLKFVKDTSLKEYNLYKKLKDKNNKSNSSDNSFSIDVFDNINNIKQSLNMKIQKRNSSFEKYNLNKKFISSFELNNNEEDNKYYKNIFDYEHNENKAIETKSEDNEIY